jgi:hypothetical protein
MSHHGFIVGSTKLPALPELPRMTSVTESDYRKAVDALDSAWSLPLEDLAEVLRVFDHYGGAVIGSAAREATGRRVDDDRRDRDRLALILSARATLEAAESQRVEARELVAATRLLVFATWVLALVAVAVGVLPDLLS